MDEQLTFELEQRPTIKGFPKLRRTGKRPPLPLHCCPLELGHLDWLSEIVFVPWNWNDKSGHFEREKSETLKYVSSSPVEGPSSALITELENIHESLDGCPEYFY